MKHLISKKVLVAGIALLTMPAAVLAQKEDKDKSDKKDQWENIVINRSGDLKDKTVIEIDGDKIKVNGKEVKPGEHSDNISVHRNRIQGVRALSPSTWSYSYNDDNFSLFDEDDKRAMLGVATASHAKGALIHTLTKESGADKAGLKKGDVITRIGDDKIEDPEDVSKIIRKHKPGDKVKITYLRDDKEQSVTAELGKYKGVKISSVTAGTPRINQYERVMPDRIPHTMDDGGGFYFPSMRPRLGLSIQDTDDGKGVKVLEVEEEGNAAKAGVKKDDVITHMEGSEINSTDEATRLIRNNKDKASFKLQVIRDGKSQTIEVKQPRKLKTADL
ncbi:MAG TPA: PDZ domain-containing protein [Flavisolibacter sp.]|jgi:serine protease Do